MGIIGLFKPNPETIKAKKGVMGLTKALKHKDRDLREKAAKALGEMGLNTGRIAFASNRDANYQIYVINADGSGQTRLTKTRAWISTQPGNHLRCSAHIRLRQSSPKHLATRRNRPHNHARHPSPSVSTRGNLP